MISSLPIGEKLSLKGKLFELSKKLQMIELENQNLTEYTFAPEINHEFELPDREHNFEANMKRAEMIRLQKMEMLKSNLTSFNDSVCTFSPQINKRSQKILRDTNPEYTNKSVTERLFEKAVESLKAKQELIERGKIFDENGKRMFVPTIPKPNRIIPASSQSVESCSQSSMADAPKGNSITAGEYMYRDAANREERLKNKVRNAQAEANRGANCHKNSKKSVIILGKKVTKEVLAAFELLDEKGTGSLTFEDFQCRLETLGNVGKKFANDDLYETAELAWHILDKDHAGVVLRSSFKSICVPIMLRETSTGSWSSENALPVPSVMLTLSDASLSFDRPPVCAVSKNKELSALRLVLRTLVERLKSNPELIGNTKNMIQPSFRAKYSRDEDSFSPIINRNSRVLASERRKKLMSESASHASRSTASDPSVSLSMEGLYPHSRDKRQRLQDLLEAEEKDSCTFHPRLFKPLLKRSANLENVDSEIKGDGSDSQARVPVYDKLFQLRDRPKRISKKTLEHIEKIKEEEEKELTFKPTLNVKAPPPPEVVNQPGFDEAIERMRAGRNKIMTESDRRTLEIAESDQRYKAGREKLAKGFVPPSFLSEDRINKSKRKKALNIPRLFVDVQLSSTKVASIPIMEGDNPATIAKSFCMIYALDKPARIIVEEVVRQSMEVNLLQITEEEKNIEIENPLILSSKSNELRRASMDEISVSSSSSYDDDYSSSYSDTEEDDEEDEDEEEDDENENV